MFTIESIISTLNGIEVKGRDNMDKLLGCILALEAMAEAQRSAEAPEETEEVKETDG